MTELTGVEPTSSPCATAFITSRSVRMPSRVSPSMTSREPVCCCHIRIAASLSVSDGDSLTLAFVMTSATFITPGSFGAHVEVRSDRRDPDSLAGSGDQLDLHLLVGHPGPQPMLGRSRGPVHALP